MGSTRRALPAILAAASTVFLLVAGTAAAAVSTGESTTVFPFEEPIPEATLVKGSASYDTAGSVSFTFATAAPPLEEVGGKENEIDVEAIFLKSSGPCDSFSSVGLPKPPIALLVTSYSSPEAAALVEVTEEKLATATKLVSGSTTTLTATSSDLADVGLNCTYLTVTNENEGASGGSAMVFPLIAPPPPPPPPPPPAPKPPPPKLAIVKPKPVALKPGKWKTVKVKVKNVSEFSSKQGTLKVKPAKGIKLRPASQKLPALSPGGSWTLSFQVQASQEAKTKSTLPITGAAPGSTAKSSLTVKLKS